ncbi:plastocyanin/azurin family copper-binding protein [Halorarius halobius]|uniref:plastocyanin/azurin family copper-binding protein n=1 Tax=Halorarius halobius TaxID=2962671 RepID=UPI0020CFB7FE|nr:plastocyanin/azurin family copper-binding protein [Halorarius halobius]
MDRRTFLAATGTGATAALAGCFGTGLAEEEFDVGMTANRFDPERIEVSVGDRVVWGNNSSRGHSVTAYEDGLPEGAAYFASGGFDAERAARDEYPTGIIESGETYAHTFETAGEFPYFCIPHERGGMVGTVVVTE